MFKTVFGDLRRDAVAVYRVQTQSSVYILGIHEVRGRRYVVVRGAPGTERENVVVRDSDPRVGEQSLFDVPPDQWTGHMLEIATMTTTPVTTVTREEDAAMIAGVTLGEHNPWARPKAEPVKVMPPAGAQYPPIPAGVQPAPRIALGLSRGTSPLESVPMNLAKQVVVGKPAAAAEVPEPEVPYPMRHVRYAENVAALLRSIARRERIFDDIGPERELRERLRRALDDSALLLETIRRRDRT